MGTHRPFFVLAASIGTGDFTLDSGVVKRDSARTSLASSNDGLCPPFGWASGKAFGLFIMVLALLASGILSSCGSTSSAGQSSNPSSNAFNGNLPSAVPSGVGGSNDVTLSWNASVSSGVIGYNIYRGSGAGGPYTKLNATLVAATDYTDNAVQSGQTYYYVVTATNSGDVESAFSGEVAAQIP